MIDLVEIARWVKTLDIDFRDCVSAGCLGANLDRCVGVYERTPRKRDICIGGEESTLTHEQRISILLHWTNRPEQARRKAWELYETLCGAGLFDLGGAAVQYLDPGAGPISIGRDETGVYEYTIEATIYYERKKLS